MASSLKVIGYEFGTSMLHVELSLTVRYLCDRLDMSVSISYNSLSGGCYPPMCRGGKTDGEKDYFWGLLLDPMSVF